MQCGDDKTEKPPFPLKKNDEIDAHHERETNSASVFMRLCNKHSTIYIYIAKTKCLLALKFLSSFMSIDVCLFRIKERGIKIQNRTDICPLFCFSFWFVFAREGIYGSQKVYTNYSICKMGEIRNMWTGRWSQSINVTYIDLTKSIGNTKEKYKKSHLIRPIKSFKNKVLHILNRFVRCIDGIWKPWTHSRHYTILYLKPICIILFKFFVLFYFIFCLEWNNNRIL